MLRIQLIILFILALLLNSCINFENEQELYICEEVFIVVEQMPVLIGGMSELQQQVIYPEEARENGVEGRVTVEFVVNKAGNARDLQVIRGIGAGADEEALRVVEKSSWRPGTKAGEPVCVSYALSINFRLEN